MNAGVIFLLCVACCFILLYFAPLPSSISQPSCGPWRPCWLGTPWGLQGPLSVEGMRRGHRGERSRYSPSLRRVAISTSSLAEPLIADAAIWDAVLPALPAHTEPPALLWPPVPLGAISSSPPRALPGHVPGCILLLPVLLVCSLPPARPSRSLPCKGTTWS